MRFEEQFPSLKVMWDENTKEGIFYREEIQEHCKDNQRINEAIDKMSKLFYNFGRHDNISPKEVLNLLRRELGLEKSNILKV